jgi:DNA-binding PadR family transcriptional regulator
VAPGIDSTSLYGTLNLLILQAVPAEPLHGLAIARRIRESTEESLRIEEGALYPALRRLARERERWVEHTLAVSKLLEVGLELA